MKFKYPLIRKAYEIDLSKISEGFLFDSIIAHEKTRSKARSALFNKARTEGLEFMYLNDHITFLNLPILRCPRADIYLFEGKNYKMWQIEETLQERKRLAVLDDILSNPTISHCYIRKRGSFYRSNYCGYTDFKERAGVYTKQDAFSAARGVSEIELLPIDVEEHNAMIIEAVGNLEKQLIIL